jgi:uncharacterized protein (TIGR03437 family)
MRFALVFITSSLASAGEFTTSLGDVNPYVISALTTDSAGNTYVVGSRELGGTVTFSMLTGAMLPIVFESPGGGSDVFVSKLDPNGKLLFTDTFAGKGIDTGTAIALDPSGNIYIAGTTTSNDFPLSRPLINQPSTSGTGFIVKLTNDGTTILYSTYFGGTLGATSITSLATDSNGNLYLTGITTASDFPRTAGTPFGPIHAGSSPVSGAIIASISVAGDKILYSGVIAATASTPLAALTAGVGIAVDAAGNAYVACNTNNPNLPTTVFSPYGGFLAKVNAAGSALTIFEFSSVRAEMGSGSSVTFGTALSAIAVDASGNAYLAGSSSALQTTPGSLQPVPNGSGGDGFLAKLAANGTTFLWATYLPGSSGATPQSISIDGNGNVWATGTGAVPNTNGWTTGSGFLIGVNSSGSKVKYSALYPAGTVEQSVAVDSSGLIHVAGLNGFVSAIAPTAPIMRIFDFQNAAGGSATARISPAEVISIYGPGIGPSTAATAAPVNGFYPNTLAGVQVTINGMNMPLLYVSSNQINAVVPMELAPGAAATVRVIDGSAVSPDYPVWIDASAAQAFPTVLNQDGTVNSQTNPAKSGSTITFYGTGWQSSFYPLADGQVATAAQDACMGTCYLEANSFFIISTVDVLYAGTAPGIVAGVSQFNIRFGDITGGSGQNTVNLLVGGPASLILTVWAAP